MVGVDMIVSRVFLYCYCAGQLHALGDRDLRMNLLYQKLAPHCALQVRPSRDRSGEELTPRALNRAADPLVTAGGFRQKW